MRIDRAGVPFILAASVPALATLIARAWITSGCLLALPIAIGLFFRDPDRSSPGDRAAVLAPADGTVMFAGPATADAPAGDWRQVTIFLSPLDVHINRTPVSGRVTRITFVKGTFVPAYRHDASRNEHSEIWLDHDGQPVVARQIVGALARRVVCRLREGEVVTAGARLGLMKFGSRMDVFVPSSAELLTRAGARVRGGETIVARLAE